MEEEVVKRKNVFRIKNFTLAFLGALVSNMGNIIYSFAVSFYILALTNNNAFIQGAYLATGGIVYLLVTLFGGVISDRFNKGKIMYICDYIKGAVLIGFTLILMLVIKENNAKVVVLFVIAVISNIIAAIFSPAAGSLLPHIVPEESLQQAQSYYSALSSFQGIIGIVIAGVLYSVLSMNVLFLIVGACYIGSGISEMFIKYDYEKKDERLTLKTVFTDIGSGIKYIFNIKPVLYLVICILFINFFITPISSNFIPYFIATDVKGSDYLFKSFIEPEMWQSIIEVVTALAMGVMSIIISMKEMKKNISKGLRVQFLLFSLVILGLSMSYVLFNQNLYGINTLLIMLCCGSLLMGLVLPNINIPISTTLMTIVDKDKLGKVMSVMDISSQGLIPLANLLAGVAITYLGVSALLIICTIGLIITTIFVTLNKEIGKL